MRHFMLTFLADKDIKWKVRLFANGTGDLKKWYLMLPFLTLSIIR